MFPLQAKQTEKYEKYVHIALLCLGKVCIIYLNTYLIHVGLVYCLIIIDLDSVTQIIINNHYC